MFITSRARGGRLDISMLTDDTLIVAEAKVSFDKMVTENRYITQLLAYEEEIVATITKLKIAIKHYKFLLIGGRESDLLPQWHPKCTSKTGNRSDIFYNSVIEHNLFFISANALLSLGLLKLFHGNKYAIEDIVKTLFDNHNIGLLSCGIISKKGNEISIQNLNI